MCHIQTALLVNVVQPTFRPQIEVLDDEEDVMESSKPLIKDVAAKSSSSKSTKIHIEDVTPSKHKESQTIPPAIKDMTPLSQPDPDTVQSQEFLAQLEVVRESAPAKKGVIGIPEVVKERSEMTVEEKIWDLAANVGSTLDRRGSHQHDDELEGLD